MEKLKSRKFWMAKLISFGLIVSPIHKLVVAVLLLADLPFALVCVVRYVRQWIRQLSSQVCYPLDAHLDDELCNPWVLLHWHSPKQGDVLEHIYDYRHKPSVYSASYNCPPSNCYFLHRKDIVSDNQHILNLLKAYHTLHRVAYTVAVYLVRNFYNTLIAYIAYNYYKPELTFCQGGNRERKQVAI